MGSAFWLSLAAPSLVAAARAVGLADLLWIVFGVVFLSFLLLSVLH